MNRKARKMIAATALLSGVILAGYAGDLFSHSHPGADDESGQTMYLGTITVTPEGAPHGDARYARNTSRHYAEPKDRHDAKADDEARSTI